MAVALEAEARPFINHFRLRRNLSVHPFALYQNDHVSLIVSGIGKVNMAAAVGYLALHSAPFAWLNIGLAGHPTLELGTLRLAHKILDGATGRAFYPQLVINAPVPTETLITVSRPESQYRESALYDMEASGFFEAARHFTTIEWLHVVKVVSDNRQKPFPREQVTHLAEKAIPIVEDLIEQLFALQETLEEPLPFDLSRIAVEKRLTEAQKRQLEKLLRRWQAWAPETLPTEAELLQLERETLLSWLRKKRDG